MQEGSDRDLFHQHYAVAWLQLRFRHCAGVLTGTQFRPGFPFSFNFHNNIFYASTGVPHPQHGAMNDEHIKGDGHGIRARPVEKIFFFFWVGIVTKLLAGHPKKSRLDSR
jgi:hypothetical protein